MSLTYCNILDTINELEKKNGRTLMISGYIYLIVTSIGLTLLIAMLNIEFWFNVDLATLCGFPPLNIILTLIALCFLVIGMLGVNSISKTQIAKNCEARKTLLIELKKHLLNLGIRTREDVLMLQKEIESETNRQSCADSYLNSITIMLITSILIPSMRKILSLSFLSEFIEMIGKYKLLQDPNLLLKVIACSAAIIAMVIYIVRSFYLLIYNIKRILDKKEKVRLYLEDVQYLLPRENHKVSTVHSTYSTIKCKKIRKKVPVKQECVVDVSCKHQIHK